MPRKFTRRLRGGVQGTVNAQTGVTNSVGTSAPSGGDISFSLGNAPGNIKAIKSNPNQVVSISFLFIIFILVVLMRQVFTPGVIANKLSISVVAFTLGAGLIGYYLLTGGNNKGLIVDMYLYFSIIVIGYWLWLLFFADGYQPYVHKKKKKDEN